jgi:hypothetical protein
MSRRASILGRLRRLKNGAARYVVAALALAYLSAGIAPCAIAAAQPVGDPLETVRAGGEHLESAHAHHDERGGSGLDHHGDHGSHDSRDGQGTPVHGDHAPSAQDHGDHECPHCPAGAASAQSADHSSCFALEDLTNVAASHAKDVPQPLAPTLACAAVTLPPPLASPPPPLRAAAIPLVPLNVRHCVFLI